MAGILKSEMSSKPCGGSKKPKVQWFPMPGDDKARKACNYKSAALEEGKTVASEIAKLRATAQIDYCTQLEAFVRKYAPTDEWPTDTLKCAFNKRRQLIDAAYNEAARAKEAAKSARLKRKHKEAMLKTEDIKTQLASAFCTTFAATEDKKKSDEALLTEWARLAVEVASMPHVTHQMAIAAAVNVGINKAIATAIFDDALSSAKKSK